MFGPPGKSRGPVLFYFANLFLWGYPVYFRYVSSFNLYIIVPFCYANYVYYASSYQQTSLFLQVPDRLCCSIFVVFFELKPFKIMVFI